MLKETENQSEVATFQVAPEASQLTARHYKECIEKRGLNPQWVLANCLSVVANYATQYLGYTAKSDGIWLKGCNHQSQYKPDKPWKKEGDKKAAKYRSPLGEYDAMLPKHPTNPHYWDDIKTLKKIAYKIEGHPCLVLTEGFFKAIAGCSNGIPTIALLGVEMGLTSKDADPQGKRYLVKTLECYARAGFGFIFALDADCADNKNVLIAQYKLVHQLKLFKAPLYSATGLWTVAEGKGMDDYIHNHGSDRFKREVLGKVVDITAWEKQFAQTDNGENLIKKATKPPTPRQLGLELAEQYQPIWAFHNEQKIWRIYNGRYWEAIEEEAFAQQVFNVIEARGVEWSLPAYVDNVIKILRHKLLIPQWISFDRKHYVAFRNGVLNVQTGELEKHDSGYRFVSCLERDYKKFTAVEDVRNNALELLRIHCPHTYTYMMWAMNGDEKRVFKLLAIVNGAIKFRFYDLQMFVHLVGKPGSGKSTFARLLQTIVSKANHKGSRLQKLNDDYELAKIINAQLVVCPDEDKQVGSFGGLKALTGGDTITYREIYQKAAEAPFYGCIVVISNNPIFAGDTSGLDRRLCLVSFSNQLPALKRNSQFEALLEAEIEELTSVSLTLSDTQVTELIRGIGDAEIPEFKRQEWLMKVQTNSIASHLNEWLICDPNAQTLVGDGKSPDTLFGHYRSYCETSGLKPFSLVAYSTNLLEICNDINGWGVTKERKRNGVVIKGIRIRQSGIDDHIPPLEDSFAQQVPNGEGLVQGCEGLCEGFKPSQGEAGEQMKGLDGNKVFNENAQIHNSQLPQMEKQLTSSTEPFTVSQSTPAKGFNPTPNPTPNPTLAGTIEANAPTKASQPVQQPELAPTTPTKQPQIFQVGDRCHYSGAKGAMAVTCRGKELEVLNTRVNEQGEQECEVKASSWCASYWLLSRSLKKVR